MHLAAGEFALRGGVALAVASVRAELAAQLATRRDLARPRIPTCTALSSQSQKCQWDIALVTRAMRPLHASHAAPRPTVGPDVAEGDVGAVACSAGTRGYSTTR